MHPKSESHGELFLLQFHSWLPDRSKILRMPRQHGCRDMCKIVYRSFDQNLYESEMDFLIKFRLWWRIVSEKVPSPGYHGSGIYESGTQIIMNYAWFRDLYSRKWLHPMVYWVLEIWYVAMVAVTGCTTLVLYLLVKPLQLIRRSGIRKFHLYTDARSLNEL